MIRRARLTDLDALAELENMFPTDRMSRRSLRQALRSPSICLWVACDAQGVCGSLVLFTRQRSRQARIYSVGVHPRARGCGYASQLLAAAEHHARRTGAVRMSLEVRQDNTAALSWYRHAGYQIVRELPAYYGDGTSGWRLHKAIGTDLPIGADI